MVSLALRAAWGTLLLLSVLLSALAPQRAAAEGAEGTRPVSMELVLLIDVSASVDSAEYALQAQGLAAAFASRPVREAIAATSGGLAIAVVQWADKENQRKAIDWTLIESERDAQGFALGLAAMPRLIDGGHTAVGNALTRGLAELEGNGFAGLRRVIDLSGDGRTNDGRPLRGARREVLERGITINGLAILNELPLLAGFFRDHLIGGEGAFVVTAADYADFERAMTEKLLREIGSMPLAGQSRRPFPQQASRPGSP